MSLKCSKILSYNREIYFPFSIYFPTLWKSTYGHHTKVSGQYLYELIKRRYINIQISFENRTQCQLQFNLSFRQLFQSKPFNILCYCFGHSSQNNLVLIDCQPFLWSLRKIHSQITISLSQMLLWNAILSPWPFLLLIMYDLSHFYLRAWKIL